MLPKKTKSASRKRRLIKLVTLLLINGVVAHHLIREIAPSSQEQPLLVKNTEVSAQDAAAIEEGARIDPINNEKPSIAIYKVQSGDTISGIADKFHVSANTIRWANDLDAKAKINVGDSLTILPVTGIQYKIKSGDTISGIAQKFHADSAEIAKFNDLEDGKLKAGETIIIPDGEPVITAKASETKKSSTAKSSSATILKTPETKENSSGEKTSKKVATSGYYTHPIPSAVLTQGLHGYNSVDFGAPIGTPVRAAADGKVIVVKGGSGWNGGYGNYIVIKHDNGTETLYAHLNSIDVSIGETVSKGEQIGKSGNTGRSTGPHLHFEVRGGTNPWVGISKGTKY